MFHRFNVYCYYGWFCAINANYVTVAITAPAEDLLAQEVEVKNGAGVVVPVKPLDIAAGDETAEFEFVTPAKTEDLVGVWTVNGVEYNLDLFNKLSNFLNAGDQLALNKALTDLEINNVKVENMPEYFTAKGNVTKTAEELTVADVQKLVDDVNAAAVNAEDEAAIVKAVVEAKNAGNEVALLQALQNEAFIRVNPEWISTVTNGYMTKILGTETKISEIQTVINTSNDTILKTLGTLTTTGIDRAKLATSKALIEAWATVDKDGKITDGTIKTYPDLIDIQLAVADVVGATTPTSLKTKLTVLAELDKSNLDMKNYIDANGKAYVAAIAAEADKATNLGTTVQINALLTYINGTEATSLVDAVYNAASASTVDADALLKALNDLGLKQVAASNKEVYKADAADFKTESTTTTNGGSKEKADVQAQVDKSNVKAVTAATDADKLLEALKVLELDNIVDANKDAYLADVTGGAATIKTDATTIDAALKVINQAEAEAAQLKIINEAETVAEVKSALDELANVDKVADYLKIKRVDRDFVAAYVLDKRAEEAGSTAKQYDDVAAVEAQVTAAQTAHAAALAGINGLTLTSTPDEVVTELDKILDEDFAALSNVEKVNTAETFHAQLTFSEDGKLKTPFTTLADVKALLK